MVAHEIFHAAESGNIDFLKQFDSKSLNDSVCDAQGRNCLHYASIRGGVHLLKYLVDERHFKGNKRSNVGATAAHDASAAGNLEALKWLLQYGACNPDDQDGTGATVLHLSCRFQHTSITEWLLDTGKVDVSQKTASGGLPLHFAVVGGDYDSVKLLIEEDPSTVNLQLSNGATPTYLAAQEGHLEILRALIQDHRGNVRIKSYDGMSCVHAAAQCGHLDCVRFLVDEEKCNVNERDFDGATPLHFAASQGHHIVIDWLMKIGKAAVTLDNLGGSPLHNAAERNYIECVKVLIGNGCSIEIADNNGLTAAELARQCYHDNCANIIQTFQPNGQFVIDEDVAYLHSVQSPRVNPTQISGYHSNVISHHLHYGGKNDFVTNGNNVNGNYGNHNVIQDHPAPVLHRGSPVMSRSPTRARSPVYIPGNRFGQDRDSGFRKQGDFDEIRRNNSQVWSTDGQIDTGNNSLSESSLSSLSNDITVSPETKNNKLNTNKFRQHSTKPSSYENGRTFIQEQFERRNVKFLDEIETISDPIVKDKTVRMFTDSPNGRQSNNVGYASDGFVNNAHSKPATPIIGNSTDSQSVSVNDQMITPIVSNNDCVQQTSSIPAPPLPPPAPPVPPVPPLAMNGTSAPSNGVSHSVPDDVKRKSTSLPARSQTVFTADMMQSKRSTLTPVDTKTTGIQKKVENDFIVELKQATKGSALRKTNKMNDPGTKPLTPAMDFTSGTRKVMNNGAGSDKVSQEKLTGEWDPKNFYDQVPNRDILPVWKVQVQARQIAEKIRKETLVKREIEEHESRFKNMPAWKRALIEKKEAEVRVSEERKQLEQQKPVGQAKKTPSVNVVGKSGDDSNLAPWQRELRKQ